MTPIQSFHTQAPVTRLEVINEFTEESLPLFDTCKNLHLVDYGKIVAIAPELLEIYVDFNECSTLVDVINYVGRNETRIALLNLVKFDNDVRLADVIKKYKENNLNLYIYINHLDEGFRAQQLEDHIYNVVSSTFSNPDDIPRKRIRIGEEYPRYYEKYKEQYEVGDITVDSSGHIPMMKLQGGWLCIDDYRVSEYLAAQEVTQPQTEEPTEEATQSQTDEITEEAIQSQIEETQQQDVTNMKAIRFLSRTNGLVGMTNLKNALIEAGVNAKRVKNTGSSYRPGSNVLVVNWGNVDTPPSWYSDDSSTYTVLNKQSAINIAKNKKKTFEKLSRVIGISSMLPEFTTNNVIAERWIDEGNKVFCRTLLEASSGDGIVVASNPDELVSAPLYVKGIKTKHEYRVHVVNGETLIQRKAKLNSDTPHQDIRNHEAGYHFINEFTASDSIREVLSMSAKRAVQGIGLDFGSVDICTTDTAMYILEVNSASGLTAPTTIAFYRDNLMNAARN